MLCENCANMEQHKKHILQDLVMATCESQQHQAIKEQVQEKIQMVNAKELQVKKKQAKSMLIKAQVVHCKLSDTLRKTNIWKRMLVIILQNCTRHYMKWNKNGLPSLSRKSKNSV